MSYSIYGRIWPNSGQSVALTLLCHFVKYVKEESTL